MVISGTGLGPYVSPFNSHKNLTIILSFPFYREDVQETEAEVTGQD